jgi:hypothetical protein
MPNFRVVLTLCLFLLQNTISFTQVLPSVEGQWRGILTQEQGGYLGEYEFEIFFQTDDDGQLAGKTYVRAPNVVGVLTFTGRKRGAVYYISEKELRHSEKPTDLSWCFKTMQLRLVKKEGDWYLEGPWQGTSEYGKCIPGWLSLQYVPPRA